MNHLVLTVPAQQTKRTIDGDTFTVFDFTIEGEAIIRVLGVDTPEHKQPLFEEAKQFTAAWLAKGPYTVDISNHDSFGRYLAIVSRGDERLDQQLILHNLGKVK